MVLARSASVRFLVNSSARSILRPQHSFLPLARLRLGVYANPRSYQPEIVVLVRSHELCAHRNMFFVIAVGAAPPPLNRSYNTFLAACLGCLAGWLADSLASWLIGWLVCRLLGWIGGLAGWLAGWLAGMWLTDWLPGWLTDWLLAD